MNCQSRQIQTRCSTPSVDSALWMKLYSLPWQADKMVVIPCYDHITWSSTCSSLHTTLFSPLVPYTHNCHSSMHCTSCNVTVWQSCFPETNHCALFECTHLLILRPFASMRHACTSFHVSTCLEALHWLNKALTLTLLVTRDMSLLDLGVCHLSGNVINYWWYTGLHISQVWSCSDRSIWVLHFS